MTSYAEERISGEEISAIKEELEKSGYEFWTICLDEGKEVKKYTNIIAKGRHTMQIEIRISEGLHGHGKPLVSGKLMGTKSEEAEYAKNRLEEIYRDIIDKRASNILDTKESGHIHTTG